MRRALLPGHPLAFEEPAGASAAALRWPFILAAVLPLAGSTALIVRDGTGPAARQTSDARAAAAVAAEVAASSELAGLAGPALEHARATFAAAETTLDRLADTGWRAVLGQATEGPSGERLGADAVVERAESFDPFGD